MGFNLKGLTGMALLRVIVLGLMILVLGFCGEMDIALSAVDKGAYLGKSDPLSIF
jgi:predicted CDP-diglyceride synthetase/phosphatidate cytidylyltransferase